MTKNQNKAQRKLEQRMDALEQRVAVAEAKLKQAIDRGHFATAGNNGATPPATETELIQ